MEENKEQRVQVRQPEQPQTNPFAVQKHQSLNHGTVQIEESRAVAEAQGKLVVAKKFPRDEAGAFSKMLQSTARVGLAEAATYAYPRGGQTISGPSIRLAEELARVWGNVEYGIRELSQQDGVSEMEAYCWDLEANIISSQKFTVKHERHSKDRAGNKQVTILTDPRDIYELTANQGGRRLRSRILAILPPDLIESALEECRKTLAGQNSESLQERIQKMIRAFSALGVSQQHIEKYCGCKLNELLVDKVVELQAVYTSIKDGVRSATDYFSQDGATTEAAITALNSAAAPGEENKQPAARRKVTPKADKTTAKAEPPAVTENKAADAPKGDKVNENENPPEEQNVQQTQENAAAEPPMFPDGDEDVI